MSRLCCPQIPCSSNYKKWWLLQTWINLFLLGCFHELEGIKEKVLKIVIKIQWGRWNKIGRKFMVAEATWCFIVPFSLLFMCLKFFIIEMKDLLSLQSYQLRFEPHLIWRLALCLYSIVGFFSQMKKMAVRRPHFTSTLDSDVLKLPLFC